MSQNITLTSSQIIQQLKISCQIPTVFKDIYRREVIKQTALAKKIVIDEDRLQEAADDFRYSQNLLSSEATFEWLERHGLSTNDFEELIYTNVLTTTLAHHLFNERVEPYFYANKTNYTQAVLYEIVLSDCDLAIELFYGIQEGEFSFWELAHNYIEDVELRRLGGYRGLLRRNSLAPAVSAQVFAAKPPQLLKPIVVEGKAHLILVEELIYPKLNETLRHDIIKELFEEWLDKQFLNVRLEAIKFDR